MEAEKKLQVLQELLDVDFSFSGYDLCSDVLRLVAGIVNEDKHSWYEDDEFIDILLDEFEDDHPIWTHIVLE